MEDKRRHKRELNQKLASIRRKEAHDANIHSSKPGLYKKRPVSILVDRICNVRADSSQKRVSAQETATEEHNDDYIVQDYGESEAEISQVSTVYSPEVVRLLTQMGHPTVLVPSEESEWSPKETKIIFASRTHSQLGQFAAELKKVTFPEYTSASATALEPARHIALASRKNLCIHPTISTFPTDMLNDACLELQEGKTTAKRCEYLPQEPMLKREFRDQALAQVADIEDLVVLGKKLGVCPYYSARLAIPVSEIITVPYPLLLNASARDSLGIVLEGNIIIIDEAHNLIDTINNLSSATIRLSQLVSGLSGLQLYMAKYAVRLNGMNKTFISQLIKLIEGLIVFLQLRDGEGNGEVKPSEILANGGDAVNVHNITKYLRFSKLAYKVDGFLQSQTEEAHRSRSSNAVLNSIQAFLNCLSNPSREGRFFFETTESSEMALKYLLLDPSHAFSDVVRQARSVVLAGGTMEPMSDFIDLLFPNASERIRTFSYGHVIPEQNLTAMILGSGPSTKEFRFTFARRYDKILVRDLGRAILNISRVVPDGIVVFFASYKYLEYALQTWKETDLLASLEKSKPIFTESKEIIVEDMLRTYSLSIDAGKGGLLLAVVGGKLSEGINFSDALGRAIIMVGLPFPNANTAEWKAKMSYVQSATTSRLLAQGIPLDVATLRGKEASQEHYENVAMRAVNQSIGRAIRHRNDYAAIILLDQRYADARVQQKLPGWIKKSMNKDSLAFGNMMQQLGQYFRERKAHNLV